MSKVKRLKSQFSRRAFAPPPPHPPLLVAEAVNPRPAARAGGAPSAGRGAAPPGPRAPPGGPRIDPKPS